MAEVTNHPPRGQYSAGLIERGLKGRPTKLADQRMEEVHNARPLLGTLWHELSPWHNA